MSKIKNFTDSVRRTLKAQNIKVNIQQIQFVLLNLYPNQDDWLSPDVRAEVIKKLKQSK